MGIKICGIFVWEIDYGVVRLTSWISWALMTIWQLITMMQRPLDLIVYLFINGCNNIMKDDAFRKRHCLSKDDALHFLTSSNTSIWSRNSWPKTLTTKEFFKYMYYKIFFGFISVSSKMLSINIFAWKAWDYYSFCRPIL